MEAPSIARDIEEPLARLHYEARSLRASDDPPIDAATRALELVLYLLWPLSSGAHLTLLADGLKEVIDHCSIKACYYMDLTSFPLMIGAIAAGEDSVTRAWFVNRLSRAVRMMRLQGWDEPLGPIHEKLVSDISLGTRFRALLRQLHDADTNLNAWSTAETSQEIAES